MAQARGPADGDGAGTEEEEVGFAPLPAGWVSHRRRQQVNAGQKSPFGAPAVIKSEEGKMPKMKTKKAAAKRFAVRASGSIKRGQATKRHILTKRTTKNKRHLRGTVQMHDSDVAAVKRMLPYA
jgi:large subunit ribosomal protein L35